MSRAPLPARSDMKTYEARLTDAEYWRPHVEDVLHRHHLPVPEGIHAGFPGSFPTFQGGDNIVKFFGAVLQGERCYCTEVACLGWGLEEDDLPVPALLATGLLRHYGDWGWPYIVMSRVPGMAIRQVRPYLPFDERLRLALTLGFLMRRVHRRPLPPGHPDGFDTTSWMQRMQQRIDTGLPALKKVLPAHLYRNAVEYCRQHIVSPERTCLVHADINDDHVFVVPDGQRWRLSGIIDWGDAQIADPYYELPTMHLLLWDADRRMLQAFLQGYGWGALDMDRALAHAMCHQFNPLEGVKSLLPLESIASLDELAEQLFAPQPVDLHFGPPPRD